MLYEHITKDMTHKKFVKEVGKSSSSYMVSSRVDCRCRHVCVAGIQSVHERCLAALADRVQVGAGLDKRRYDRRTP